MAFCNINDINLEISTWVIDFKLFLRLSILNKKSYVFVTDTLIYRELNILKDRNVSFPAVHVESDAELPSFTKLQLNNKNMIKIYYELGLINILKKIKTNNEIFVSGDSINCASENNHINILDWLKDSDLEFEYTENAIDSASTNGHINILEWFKNSNLEFKYTDNAIDLASTNGHINILEWFLNSNLEFKYTDYAINLASKNGHINILEW